MPSIVKHAAVGFAWYLAFVAVQKIVVKPLATQLNIPVIKDL